MKKDKIQNVDELRDYESHYSESSFWDKILKNAVKAGKSVIEKALLLYYVLVSPDVPIKYKSVIIGALGYLILPVDLVPDLLPGVGFVDDAAALSVALATVKDAITPEIKAQVDKKLNEIFS